MSWLKPENIPPSDYDPHKVVEAMVEKHGKLSRAILSAFNEIDPLHVFYGDNVDEYHGYAERFMTQLGDKDLNALTEPEVVDLVRKSFHADQIAKGFVQEYDIVNIAKEIYAHRTS